MRCTNHVFTMHSHAIVRSTRSNAPDLKSPFDSVGHALRFVGVSPLKDKGSVIKVKSGPEENIRADGGTDH